MRTRYEFRTTFLMQKTKASNLSSKIAGGGKNLVWRKKLLRPAILKESNLFWMPVQRLSDFRSFSRPDFQVDSI